MNKVIINLQNKLNAATEKRDKAFRDGNFTAVNRYTKEIVKTQLLINQIKAR